MGAIFRWVVVVLVSAVLGFGTFLVLTRMYDRVSTSDIHEPNTVLEKGFYRLPGGKLGVSDESLIVPIGYSAIYAVAIGILSGKQARRDE